MKEGEEETLSMQSDKQFSDTKATLQSQMSVCRSPIQESKPPRKRVKKVVILLQPCPSSYLPLQYSRQFSIFRSEGSPNVGWSVTQSVSHSVSHVL